MVDGLTADAFSRGFLATFFASVAVFYTLRVLAAMRRTGVSPVLHGQPGSRHRLHHDLFRLFRLAILVVCVTRAFWPGLDPYLVPLRFLQQPAILLGGDLLLLISLGGVLYVQAYMAQDWRSGIDEGRATPLLAGGPFALSRNPIFLFVLLGQLGLFLALPSLFTLVCLVVGVLVIHGQARLEEAHLEARHGAAFAAYRARVPRWLSATLRRARSPE